MNKDLRLGFASDDFAGTVEEFDTARWSDGTETTLTLPACCGGVQGLPGPAGQVEAEVHAPCVQGTLLKLLFGATSRCLAGLGTLETGPFSTRS